MKRIMHKFEAIILCILLIIPAITTVSAVDMYSTMFDSLLDYKEEINLKNYNIPEDDFPAVFDRLIKSNPELFHVSKAYGYSVTSTGYIVALYPKYILNENEYTPALEYYRAEVDKIASTAEVWMTDLEKIAVIHDYIVTHFEYDKNYKIYDAYTLLKTGTGVCQAYSLLFTGVMRKLGIGVDYAISNAKNHMWNVVELDGEWYHIDTTWDDPLPDRYGYADHSYMLKSDAFIMQDSEHGSDTESAKICSSTKYDTYFWTDINTCFVAANRDIYCFNNNSKTLDKCNLEAQTIVPIYTLDARWTVGNGAYKRSFSSIMSYNDVLYFNSPTAILRLDPMTDSLSTEYEPDLTDGWIYGFVGSNNRISYYNTMTPFDSSNGISTYDITEYSLLLGDSNVDGHVNMIDIFKLRRFLSVGDIINKNCADMNSDGILNTNDSLLLQMYLAGKD